MAGKTGAGGGGAGNAAEESGQLSWSAQAGMTKVDERLYAANVVVRDFRDDGSGKFVSNFMWLLAVGAVATGGWHVLAEVTEKVRGQATGVGGVG